MAKKNVADVLMYKTVLAEVTVMPVCAKIKETPLAEITEDQRMQINIWTREKRLLLVNYAGVSATGTIKEAKVDEKGDGWKFDGFDFTAPQYETLAGFVKTKKQIKVTIKPTEKLLTDGDTEDED